MAVPIDHDVSASTNVSGYLSKFTHQMLLIFHRGNRQNMSQLVFTTPLKITNTVYVINQTLQKLNFTREASVLSEYLTPLPQKILLL